MLIEWVRIGVNLDDKEVYEKRGDPEHLRIGDEEFFLIPLVKD